MTKRVTLEMSVGLTEPIRDHLQMAVEYQGIKASTFGRQAILEKLVRDGWIGSTGAGTQQVRELIRESIETRHAVLFGVQSDPT